MWVESRAVDYRTGGELGERPGKLRGESVDGERREGKDLYGE